jgi:Rod binding domain-containing protein
MSAAVLNPGLAAPAATPPGGDAQRNDALRHAAQEFEAIFLAQVLGSMTQGLDGDELMGDGQNDVFHDMLNEEIAKLISRSGGIGVADAVLREMLKAQEVA